MTDCTCMGRWFFWFWCVDKRVHGLNHVSCDTLGLASSSSMRCLCADCFRACPRDGESDKSWQDRPGGLCGGSCVLHRGVLCALLGDLWRRQVRVVGSVSFRRRLNQMRQHARKTNVYFQRASRYLRIPVLLASRTCILVIMFAK